MKQVLIRGGGVVVEEVPAPGARPARRCSSASHYSCVSVGTELASVAAVGHAALPARARAAAPREAGARDRAQRPGLRPHVQAHLGPARRRARRPATPPPAWSSTSARRSTASRAGDRVACAGAGIANHAELIAVPVNLAVRVPDGVGLDDASTVTLGAIALQGVRRAEPTLGETVAVIGLGILGQLTVQLLRAHGCACDRLGSRPGARASRRRASGADGSSVTATSLRGRRAQGDRRLRRRRGDRHRGDARAAQSMLRRVPGVPPARAGS